MQNNSMQQKRKSSQLWGLIDCDAFFASCEIAENPKLRNKIVCVGNDIIIARTYNAKKYDINIGTPVREAKKRLPKDTVYCSPSHTRYKRISNRLINFLEQQTKILEQFSIDEAFFSPIHQDLDQDFQYYRAKQLQAEIKRIIGIPVSIGIAPTRILAKIFADKKKPYGICVGIDEERINKLLQDLPIDDIPFIGNKTAQKLADHAQTAYDFKTLSYAFIRQYLGKSGLKIRWEMNSINAKSFQNNKHQKSIGRSYSFNPDFTRDKNKIWAHLMKNFERAVKELHSRKLKTTLIQIHFRRHDFFRFGKELTLDKASNNRAVLIPKIRMLFEQFTWGKHLCRSTGIRFKGLMQGDYQQVSLFQQTTKQRNNSKLDSTIDKLNSRYGDNTVHSGSYLL